MSAERRIMAGACLLCAGVVVGCVQAWLAVTGRAPVVSGLSLLALGLGGLGAGMMLTADGGPVPAGVGAEPVPHGPAGASGAAASAPTPDTADVDDHDDAGAEDVLAAAARIVDGAVECETDAIVERVHSGPHSHLRMVLSPGGQVTIGTGAADADGGGDSSDGVPVMVCELVAPPDWMGSALMTLAEALMSPRRVREMLAGLASEGDASAVAAVEYLRIAMGDEQ